MPIARASVGDVHDVVGEFRAGGVEHFDAAHVALGTQFADNVVACPSATSGRSDVRRYRAAASKEARARDEMRTVDGHSRRAVHSYQLMVERMACSKSSNDIDPPADPDALQPQRQPAGSRSAWQGRTQRGAIGAYSPGLLPRVVHLPSATERVRTGARLTRLEPYGAPSRFRAGQALSLASRVDVDPGG
jgi:hypothetical protein